MEDELIHIESDREAVLALSYSIRSLNTAIAGINNTLQTMREQYDRDLRGIGERMTQHSMKCLFSPERDGMAEKVVRRVDHLETIVDEFRGGLALVKWMGFGTLGGVVMLALKAALG